MAAAAGSVWPQGVASRWVGADRSHKGLRRRASEAVAKAWLHAPWQRERDREETPLAAGFRVGAETEAAATVVVAAVAAEMVEG